MRHVSVTVEYLSKRYLIGVRQTSYRTLSDRLAERLRRLVTMRRFFSDSQEAFWALKDVSFEIKPGEVVGIIGRNGAGKSTLLKILSRITEPTEGRAVLHGRVSSLLEVGTGFHPELTGRDNVYLSGSLLGMKKAEIDAKFDEIVAFAEIEKFIDTPVKRYSSGMFVRLAFAVAAHLEPEILILDEVLAVGDSRFQKKCLSKMEDVGKHGRTILFVSHSMPAVARICKRAILLEEGVVRMDGPAHHVIATYMGSDVGSSAEREWPDSTTAPQGETVRLRAVRVRTEEGRVTDAIDIRQPFGVDMEYEVKEGGHVLQPFFRFTNEENVCLFCPPDLDPSWRGRPRPAGRYVTTVWLPGNLFAEGRIFVDVALCVLHGVIVQFHERNVVSFQVLDSLDGDSARGDWAGEMEGVLRPLLKWTTTFTPAGERSTLAVTKESNV
ncbi:MAG: ABC transporter ATP-binding protein [Nitrospirota bacterium]